MKSYLKRTQTILFLQIIPVRIVASNESFFKETFSSLLNYKTKCLTNSKNLLKRNGTKIDLEDVLYISKSKFSLGDLVSYSLTYSSIETILRNFEEITEIKIYSELDSVSDYLKEMELDDNLINEGRPFDKGRILKNLSETYELRNIICHDFLSASHKLKIDADTLRHYIMDTALLQISVSYLCSKFIYNDIPSGHSERIEYYNNILKNKLTELEEIYLEIHSTFNSEEQTTNFIKNKQRFTDYINSDSEDFGFWFRGENEDLPFDSLKLEYQIKLIEKRIEILREEMKNSS
ncbi:hypothetical protein [Flavobacterium psychrophilum]|uniref:hypothetical protein n=1 Tax=Flavobacterium psychrophilum TaxID=96345 RepID=UPI000B7C3C36|nr:hypothetical protein [Flavobacterium psychrophilum]SNB36685.1 hypothetical protein NO098_320002 [Flavobacterium psychrophilum]